MSADATLSSRDDSVASASFITSGMAEADHVSSSTPSASLSTSKDDVVGMTELDSSTGGSSSSQNMTSGTVAVIVVVVLVLVLALAVLGKFVYDREVNTSERVLFRARNSMDARAAATYSNASKPVALASDPTINDKSPPVRTKFLERQSRSNVENHYGDEVEA